MKKKVVSFILAICILVVSIPIQVIGADNLSVGDFLAEIDDPDASAIKIESADDLLTISDNMNGSYVLTKDIDLSKIENWSPIGVTLSNPFKGKFDGQGHSIIGLKIKSVITSGTIYPVPAHSVGLFGVCSGAQIKNVCFENVSISVENTSGYQYEATRINGANLYAGAVCGYAKDQTAIYNCISSGAIVSSGGGESQGTSFAGGMVGYMEASVTSYCQNYCGVNASYKSAMMGKAPAYTGGLIGFVSSDSRIDRSWNVGSISAATGTDGNSYSGGLVGATASAALTVTDSYNTGAVSASSGQSFSGDSCYAGGIVGSFGGAIDRTYNSGTVKASLTDPLGVGGGQAYAGGICGTCVEGAFIQNSALVQQSVLAEGKKTRATQISEGGTKTNNMAITPVLSGLVNDADIAVDIEAAKTSSIYNVKLGWNFATVWTIEEGKNFPKLKRVDTGSDVYSEEYINQHLKFIESPVYANITGNYRWAQIYWSAENNFKSNMGELLYDVTDRTVDLLTLDFGFLFEDDNLFTSMLADYVSDQTVEDVVVQLYKQEIPFELDKKYKAVTKFIKDNWKDGWGQLSDEDIFWLLHYQECTSDSWVNSDFEKHIGEIVNDSKSSTVLEKILGVGKETVDSILKEKEHLDNTIDWFNDLITYSSHVAAYVQADEEFKTILDEMCNHLPDSTSTERKFKSQLKSALEDYTQYNNSDQVTARMFANYLLDSASDYATKKFTSSMKKVMKEKVTDWIKSKFSASILEKFNKIGWFAEKTWKIMDYVTKNGELQECREMFKANAYFEDTMYGTLKAIEAKFMSDPVYKNARLFDAAFKFFKETEIASMDICISYFDTYQNAWTQAIKHLSNTFMDSAIEQVHVNKLFLYKTYCHGSEYTIGGKTITIACPTNVFMYDAEGVLVAAIEKNEVVKCTEPIQAFTTDAVKIITFPTDQDYRIEVEATDDGVMDYSISEYSGDMEPIKSVIFAEVPILIGDHFNGNINHEILAEPESYSLTGNTGITIDEYSVTSMDDTIPVETIDILNRDLEMEVGEKISVNANIIPVNASVRTVAWSSSDPDIISISDSGELCAKRVGMVTVYAKSLYGGVQDEVQICVTAPRDSVFAEIESCMDEETVVKLTVGRDIVLPPESIVVAASYDDNRLRFMCLGNLGVENTVRFPRTLEKGYKLFFLNGNLMPLCPATILS